MRSKKEIKELLDLCLSASKGFSSTTKKCPLEDDGFGCCAECSLPSALTWVLGGKNKASANCVQVGFAVVDKLIEERFSRP